jgi:hypothetical protein
LTLSRHRSRGQSLLLAICAWACLSAAAQPSPKLPVRVLLTTPDPIGQQLGFELKEAIRGSNSFQLVDDDKRPHFKLFIVSMDDTIGTEKGLRTAYSAVIVLDSEFIDGGGIFLTTSVGTCGRSRVVECARGLLPDIDQQATRLREKWPSLYKLLK